MLERNNVHIGKVVKDLASTARMGLSATGHFAIYLGFMAIDAHTIGFIGKEPGTYYVMGLYTAGAMGAAKSFVDYSLMTHGRFRVFRWNLRRYMKHG